MGGDFDMFKDKLKQLRLEHGLTQSDVAKAIGVKSGTIGNYEQGTRIPKNDVMWKKLADLFNVSVDYLMDNDNAVSFSKIVMNDPAIEEPKNYYTNFPENTPIIYEDVDITSLVKQRPDGKVLRVTKEQMFACTSFTSFRGHATFARKKLLDLIELIEKYPIEKISDELEEYSELLNNNVVYWFKRCWNNIDDLFPEVTDLSSLYDLIDKCLCVDIINAQEFYMEQIPLDFDWLRIKLCSGQNSK